MWRRKRLELLGTTTMEETHEMRKRRGKAQNGEIFWP
jgi:hypothetical protein